MDGLYNIRTVLAIGLIAVAGVLFAAGLALPVVTGDNPPLEPSIQNEVDHAIYLGEKWLEDFARTNSQASAKCRLSHTNSAPSCCISTNAVHTNSVPTNCVCACWTVDLFATNSLDREQIALKLVRSQRAYGFWPDPRDASVTNRVPVQCATRIAVSILSSL